tara:strand:+ start:2121 stop:2753 length:633 start_codon:yes stop_codon:yes gene_type:complete
MKILLLTSRNSWLSKNTQLLKKFSNFKISKIIHQPSKINKKYDICLILSYYKKIKSIYLNRCNHNLVVHESDLPKGKGFSPLYWQILNNKTNITFTLFECSDKIDTGNYYIKKKFKFSPHLLYEQIKKQQLICALNLVSSFISLKKKGKLKLYYQRGKESFYRKFKELDNQININKSIKSQIGKLRTRDNELFPAYFIYKNKKFKLKIFN